MADITGQYEIDATQTTVNPNLHLGRVALFNEDGTPFTGGGSGYTLPAATTTALGGVKQVAFGNAIGGFAADMAAAAGDAPTKVEYDALVAAYNKLAADTDRVIGALVSAGLVTKP